MKDRSEEIMRIADEIAQLAAGSDPNTARGLIECIADLAWMRFGLEETDVKRNT